MALHPRVTLWLESRTTYELSMLPSWLATSTLRDRLLVRKWQAARHGDSDAFRTIYRALHPPIEAYLARRIPERSECDDLVASCFARIVERLEQYDPQRGSLKMWAFGIARNLLHDHHRSRAKATPVDPAILDAAPDDDAGPLAQLLRDEQNHQLLDQLRQLPADARELLALRHGEGLRHREIAQLLDISEAAVRQRLSRVHHQLRQRRALLDSPRGAADYVA